MSVESQGSAGRPSAPRRIVVAEDDREMREMIASVIAADGYEVIQAGDGNELVNRLEAIAAEPHGRATVAAIICDIRMPRLDGLDVLAVLRCARWYTPVILITAFGDEAVHHEAHNLGATEVLDKPFALERLRDLVRRIALR
jgi:DNA-binding response OmpR family regulator